MILGWPLLLYSKVKYGIRLENKISWKVLKIFTQEFSNDNLGLALSFCKVKFAFWAFISEEFMDFAEVFGAKVNKYSSAGEHKNSFVH